MKGKTICAIILGACCISPALAHVFPRTQTPSAGASVSAPAQVRIVFDGPLEAAFSSVTVTDTSGKQVNTVKAVIDPQDHDAISVALPALQSGKYTVHWIAVADDGHRTHGDYAFEVK
jgi:copper resistance protein C